MTKDIELILQEGIDNREIPGLQFGFLSNDSFIVKSLGYQTCERESKVELENIYDVASLTKVIVTATMIFKLIDQGTITFETKIKDILSQYSYDSTISDLLIHTSGLPAGVSNFNEIKSKEELIALIYQTKLVYEPGMKIVYSDIGFILLGFLIEQIYGDKLDKIAKREIFEPLGMTHSSFKPEIELSIPTEYREEFKSFDKGIVHDERAKMLEICGHAGLFTNAQDLLLFVEEFLFGNKIISEKMKQTILKKSFKLPNLGDENVVRTYGYQKFVNYPKSHQSVITHTGFTGCNIIIDFDKRIGFVLLSNSIHPSRELNKIFKYREKILKLFLNFKK